MELFKPGRQFNFMGQKNIWLTVSGVVCLASLVLFIVKGLNFGTDFRGGTELELAFKKEVSAEDIVKSAKDNHFSEPQVIYVKDSEKPYRYMLRVQEVTAIDDKLLVVIQDALCYAAKAGQSLPEDRCPKDKQPTELKVSPGGDRISLRFDHDPDLEHIAAAIKTVKGVELRAGGNNPKIVSPRDHKVDIQLKSKGDQLIDGLHASLGSDVVPDEPLRVEWIGPKAGALLRDAAFKSIGISLLFLMAYIAIRYDLRFAPGAVVGLAHNVVVVLGVYMLFNFEFTLMTVASVLTLIGYSLNDTIVVYDRIRENLGKHRGKPFPELINLSISETLSRTLLTALATFLVMLAYLVFTRGAIWYFSLAFSIGIVIAPYSSIFIAAPVAEFVDRRFFGGTKSAGMKQPVRKRETAVV